LPWTANPLVLRHGRRITCARIVTSLNFYSLYVTSLDIEMLINLPLYYSLPVMKLDVEIAVVLKIKSSGHPEVSTG